MTSEKLMKPNMIRLDNMNRIIKKTFKDSVQNFVVHVWPELAEAKLKNRINYISQVRGLAKPLSESNAEQMEIALKLPEGYMSRPHFSFDESFADINDFEAMELAITEIMNQFIRSGVYLPKKDIDTSHFAAFVVSKYKDIIDKKKDEMNPPQSSAAAS